MRGLDGNYINTQGDALARMQLAYQTEQNRQQIRAQMESMEELRKLREDVNAADKKDAAGGPPEVKDDQGASSQDFEGSLDLEDRKRGSDQPKSEEEVKSPSVTHIDIRV